MRNAIIATLKLTRSDRHGQCRVGIVCSVNICVLLALYVERNDLKICPSLYFVLLWL